MAEVPYQSLDGIVFAVTPVSSATCFRSNVRDEPMNLFCLVHPFAGDGVVFHLVMRSMLKDSCAPCIWSPCFFGSSLADIFKAVIWSVGNSCPQRRTTGPWRLVKI